jgi:hypothetical protein
MNSVDLLLALVDARLRLAVSSASRLGLVLGSVAGFFNNLYTDLTGFALAVSIFFFAWAALLYGASGTTGNERTKQHAMSALYAALVGLALAFLAGTIGAMVKGATVGQ